jgi:hypothetical protein
VTDVPTAPDVGLKSNVGAPTGVTVNGAVFTSPATFVVTVTVYPPRAAAEATVKPPLNAPLEIVHVDEVKRPDGADERLQVVPS